MSDQRDDQQRALLRLARQVTARHDLEDVLTEAFREVRKVVEFGGGSIQLIDDEGWITVAASDPPAPPDAAQSRVALGSSIAGRVVLTEQAIYVADTTDAGVLPRPATADGEAKVGSYVAVPLLVDGRAVGMLRVDHPGRDGFSESDRHFIVAAGVVIAAAIQNARAQARSAASRARVEALEHRLDQVRALLHGAYASSASADPAVRDLLAGIEQQLGEPPATIEISDPAASVTL